MIDKQSLAFLKGLKENNNKPWFDAHRADYDKAKANFVDFVALMILKLEQLDPEIAAAQLEARKCVMRINRDVRFSKDKAPYKTNFGAMLNKDGKKGQGAGYYIHVEHGASFVAGGIYMPMPPQLAAIRQEIDYNFDQFRSIVTNKGFLKHTTSGVTAYASLSRPPKGYAEGNPALDYLKMKGFIATKELTNKDIVNEVGLQQADKTLAAVGGLVGFINRSLA
jgi:uncharacterized protein (TIGR02453 family)